MMPGVTELMALAIILGLVVVPAVALSKIASKAGLPRWIGITQLFPIVNMAGLLYVAFAEWPSKNTVG